MFGSFDSASHLDTTSSSQSAVGTSMAHRLRYTLEKALRVRLKTLRIKWERSDCSARSRYANRPGRRRCRGHAVAIRASPIISSCVSRAPVVTAGVYVVTNGMMGPPAWRAVMPCLGGRTPRQAVMPVACWFRLRIDLRRRDISRGVLDSLAGQVNRDLGV